MRIILTRDEYGEDYTTGTLVVDGSPVGLFACEDVDRWLDSAMPLAEIAERKVKSQTAIPTGTYQVRRTFSNRYRKLMPLVCDVPGFRGIRIHSGNTSADTAGCILPGMTRSEGFVGSSRVAFRVLDSQIADAEARGEEVWIEIKRNPGAALA